MCLTSVHDKWLSTFLWNTTVKRSTGVPDLKVLVVVGIDAETGDEAVDHEVHICVLASRPSGERLGWVEEQGLTGEGRDKVDSISCDWLLLVTKPVYYDNNAVP